MAADTCLRSSLIHIVDVALIACGRLVRAGQWKTRAAMCKCRRTPNRGIVTRQAVMRKAWQRMPRTLRLIVLRLMTGKTICILQLVVATNVTLNALCRGVSPCERKVCRRMIECCRSPRRLRVAR